MKVTSQKQTDPGAHQVFHTGTCDVIGLRDEQLDGEPLMVPVMRGGAMACELPALQEIRARCRARVAALPAAVRRIDGPQAWPVERSKRLLELRERLLREGRHRTGVTVSA
jgi:nicotinate phosphoribosyltransferase